MKLSERSAGDVTVLELAGRLVLDDGDTMLRDRVNDLIARGRLKVAVNLKDITYIDSCGIGVLIAKLVSLRNKGGDLRLVHLSSRSARVLEICKLEEVFRCFEAEEAAIASFSDLQRA